jgi:2',3'-cyclic-nucleotide 2'-phosphodiesterase (5'-nucleotidase family)
VPLRPFFLTLVALAVSLDTRAAAPSRVTLSIVGTSDLHGRIAALPWFAGFLGNLRAARARDGGAVVLVDAGDMFQGTLESNLDEGAPVVAAYNALGYAAAAIGNHEFDFGPVGPASSPTVPGDDPQGALKARAAQASFPFLAANVVDARTHEPVAWPNVRPSVIASVAGIKVGIVGVTSAATGSLAPPDRVAGLAFLPLAETVAREVRKLRKSGAKVVVAVVHEGGACQDFANPNRHASCDTRSPIFSLARDLPSGSVDAIVAGHTHQAIAHRVRSVPIIQSYANGRAFGRVDLTLDRRTGRVLASRIKPPHAICPSGKPAACAPGKYEGAEVLADGKLTALNASAFAAVRKQSHERLGVEVLRPLPHRRREESALGNLLADLMRQARPASDVAVLNGGAMRAGLPAGPLTYGSLYQTFPFDNVFATVRMPAGDFRAVLTRNLIRTGAQPSLSGVRVLGRCQAGRLDVNLLRPNGKPIADDEVLTIITLDFLATGGDDFFAGAKATLESGPPLREAMAEVLRARGGTLDPDKLFDAKHPRFDLPGPVPVRCRR